jgi:phosphomannomutase/phosphoglucomutase
VGGDVRLSTEPLKEALMRGLAASGCRVVDLGILPTPALYFAREYLHIESGVMVTGSHNPPDDNGFKISLGPLPITEEELALLEQRMERGDYGQGAGTYDEFDSIGLYKTFIQSKFPAGGGLRVVVDAGHGCYARIAPDVLQDVGYDVVELFCEPDGRFPGRPSNPAVAANLSALRKAVVQAGADLGAAFDGDGDRVVFVDERGRVVENDRSIVLFARYLLSESPGEVIYDIKCSSVVPEEVIRAGGVPVMAKSGHTFIKTALMQRGALLGGEISGHFFFGELGRDDGLYATLLMLKILDEAEQGLAALVDTVPRYPITPDIRLACPPVEAGLTVREVQAAFAGEAGCEIGQLDGVRIAWPDGWALVRPSVTEPLMTLRFEAHSQDRLAEIQAMLVDRSPRLKKLMESS